MGNDLGHARDLALQIADHLPPATASIVRVAASLIEHARKVTDGESADLGAALAELPAHALGAFVRDQRNAAKLSLRDLAKRTGLSTNTVRDLERGQRTPSTQTIQRLLQVPELGFSAVATAPTADDPHRPNAWFLPKYDRRGLLEELKLTVNSTNGRLEQTCLYLDDESAADWVALSSASSFAGTFRAFPFEALSQHAAQMINGRGLDVIALGPGDGRSEVRLCSGLRAAGADLNLYLLDVSHTLLTMAHKHASETFGDAVRVDALHGDFRHLGRYPVLLPAAAPHRRRCYVLLGGTLANVDSEIMFIRDCLSVAAPGDLLVIDFQLRYAAPTEPDAIRASDPVLRNGLSELHKHWFTGPLLRYGRGIESLNVGVDLLVDCIVPGSYELDVYADTVRGTSTERCHLSRVRRYEESALMATFERHGWKVEVVRKYGPGDKLAGALLRRV